MQITEFVNFRLCLPFKENEIIKMNHKIYEKHMRTKPLEMSNNL